MDGRENQNQSPMKTRIFSRFTPIGRLSAAIVIAGTLCAAAWGQTGNGASPNTQAAQELNNVQRLVQQSAASFGGIGSAAPGEGGGGFSTGLAVIMAGPTFDLEVFGGHIVRSPGDTKGPIATVGSLVNFLQEKVTNFNAIESAGVSEVPMNNFKLRAVNVVTVLNILPSITDNKVQARTIVGARGRRGGQGGAGAPGGPVGPGMQAGAVYMLELIPPAPAPSFQEKLQTAVNNAVNGAPAGSDSDARQMAVFNINNYLADLARHGKTDEKAFGIELMGVETIIGDSLERLKGSPLTPEERPQFEVHYGAGIVVVIGSAKAIDVATKIINALPGNENATGPAVPTAMSSSALFQRLDLRSKEYFTSHPENWNDYVKMNGGAANAPMDEYNFLLRKMQSLQNASSNQPGSVAPVPAPNGGQ